MEHHVSFISVSRPCYLDSHNYHRYPELPVFAFSPQPKMSATQRRRLDPTTQYFASDDSGLNERILLIVLECVKWDLQIICLTASLNRKLRAIAKRLLWRKLCVYRAPRMVPALTNGSPNGRIGGGWDALAKLMFFCCGCESTLHFKLSRPTPGHFAKASRFSKTSGRSFLSKNCRGDLLFISDPCEHPMGDKEDDLGIYRGVFRGFMRSKTRACLIRRQVAFDERVRCPYCGTRVWSMTTARLIPKSAARRLGSRDGRLEYFVCVNGHLHGSCWLVPLSSEEEACDDEDDEEDDAGSEDLEGDAYDHQTMRNGSSSSVGEDVLGDGPINLIN